MPPRFLMRTGARRAGLCVVALAAAACSELRRSGDRDASGDAVDVAVDVADVALAVDVAVDVAADVAEDEAGFDATNDAANDIAEVSLDAPSASDVSSDLGDVGDDGGASDAALDVLDVPDAPSDVPADVPVDTAADVSADAPLTVYRDCADVRARLAAAGAPLTDAEYAVDPDGEGPLPRMTVYCADLASAPLEYLSVDPEANYSRNTRMNDCTCVYWEWRFSRVRLRFDRSASATRVLVMVDDTRFTSFRYLTADLTPRSRCVSPPDTCEARMTQFPGHWAAVSACRYYREGPAHGHYDLGSTPLRFPAAVATLYAVVGMSSLPEGMQATLSPDRATLEIRFGAGCGFWAPRDYESTHALELEPR